MLPSAMIHWFELMDACTIHLQLKHGRGHGGREKRGKEVVDKVGVSRLHALERRGDVWAEVDLRWAGEPTVRKLLSAGTSRMYGCSEVSTMRSMACKARERGKLPMVDVALWNSWLSTCTMLRCSRSKSYPAAVTSA